MRWRTYHSTAEKVFWACFFLGLPLSSFPYLPDAISGGALVRPFSFYPLLGLIVLGLVFNYKQIRFLPQMSPLFLFLLVGIGSTMAAVFILSPTLPLSEVFPRNASALATLLLGISIYLCLALIPRSVKWWQSGLKWLYAGFALALGWGSLQVLYVLHYSEKYFRLLNTLQRYISTRKLFRTRVSGMTFEPNWFAEQIVFLLMPWLFASVISSHTVFKWRWRKVTIELILLLWASVVLIFTYSRAGIFLLLVEIAIAFFIRPFTNGDNQTKPLNKTLIKRLLVFVLLIALLAGVIFVLGSQNNYFSRLWNYWQIKDDLNISYFEYIAFSQRFVYWQTAYHMFEAYPLLGVGLGNYTFFFADYFQDEPLYQSPELLRKFTPEVGRNLTVTVKNLFFRLLAETGLVGTVFFLAFVGLLFVGSVRLWATQNVQAKVWGRAGVIALVVFLFLTASFDSFAIPNMWVVFGMITSSQRLYLGKE